MANQAKQDTLGSYRLVLVAPRVPGNVGACARLVANFDCPDWVIVDPQCAWDDWDAKKLATGSARERLETIRVVPTVAEAVEDCTAAVGFTRRRGKIRKPSTLLGGVPELGGKVALVFGNEETGLSAAELNSCTHTCLLPTSDRMGSMNLSHAVAVVLARVFEAHAAAPKGLKSARAANIGELEAMLDHWGGLLEDIGMTTAGNPGRMTLTLRKIFARADLSKQEIRAVRGVLSKAQVALGTRVRGRRVEAGRG